jgi:DNA-binding NarL/FixJ family response regulator
MPIRLGIVDASTLICFALRQLLAQQSDIQIVAECGTAAEASRILPGVRANVVIVNTALPDGDGLGLARQLRARNPGLGIVVRTSGQEDGVLFRAMETGMSAFIGRAAPLEEVVAAIRHAAVAASSFTASGLAAAVSRRRASQERLSISPREMEVLLLLRDGLSVPAVAKHMCISQSTAKAHVSHLYGKLGAANRAQALMTAVNQGLA